MNEIDPHVRSELTREMAASKTSWTLNSALSCFAFIRAANFAFSSDEKILVLVGGLLNDPFDEVMEAMGALIDQPGERKQLPQVGEAKMLILERRQAERSREATQHRRELPSHRVKGMPWFARLQSARAAAKQPMGDPLNEDAELVAADCDRYGIHRESLFAGGAS